MLHASYSSDQPVVSLSQTNICKGKEVAMTPRCSRLRSISTLLLGLLLAAIASPAAALDDYEIGSPANGFMPDFDQRRTPGPLVFDGQVFVNDPPGLPGNGAMYCVPTAAIDTAAYLANHGYPAAMPAGPLSWQSQEHYGLVNDAILEMGLFMDTHPVNGTLGKGRSGHQAYLDAKVGPNVFLVSSKTASKSYGPNVWELAQAGHSGQLVLMNVGWYTEQPGGQWIRTGGHQTVITGVYQNDGFFTDTAQIRFRDPGGGGNQQTQATFSNSLRNVEYVFGQFSNSADNVVFYNRTMVKIVGYGGDTTQGFLQGIYTVTPMFGIGSNGLQLDVLNPFPIDPNPVPGIQSYLPQVGATLADFAIQPISTCIFYTVRDASGAVQPDVHCLDRATGESTITIPGVAPSSMTFGDEQRIFLADGSCVHAFDLDGSTAPAASNCDTSATIDAVCYDGVNDWVLALQDASMIKVMGSDDLATLAELPLPSTLALAGEISIATNPTTGDLWIKATTSETIDAFCIDLGDPTVGSGPTLTPVDSFTDPVLAGANSIDCDGTGQVFWVKNGSVHLHSRDTAGLWTESTDSPFAGMTCDGRFRLARATENSTLEYREDLSTIHQLPEVAGYFLRGDCNRDGAFDIADAIATLGFLFSSNGTPECLDACDANDDGAVDIGDGIFKLGALFSNGPTPAAPFTDCDADLTQDSLDCASYNCP